MCVGWEQGLHNSHTHNILPVRLGRLSGCLPLNTSPVVPLREIQSPSHSTTLPTLAHFFSSNTSSASQPHTHGLPQPRATTAAWLVMPPRAVRMPSAACMPPTSSGDVSRRTRMTFSPCSCHCSASSAVKTTRPTAAPGEAGRPDATTDLAMAAGFSNSGCSSCSKWRGSTMLMACCSVTRPSATMSRATLSAA